VAIENRANDFGKILDACSIEEFQESLRKAQQISWKNFGRKIHFYAPSFMYYKTSSFCSSHIDFPTISVTGKGCSLSCKHCGGIVLNTMHPAPTPEILFNVCNQLQQEGASGCLISGGCLPNGSVPLARFIRVISRIKRELRLTVFVHTGVIDFKTALALKKAGVDAALIDITGSDETIREIYKLNMRVEDYASSLRALSDAGISFVPHVIVGLHYGKLKSELRALEMISETRPSALVIIAFMPIRGTEMERIEPPRPLDVTKIITVARLMFPETPLVLGCMRPKNKSGTITETLSIQAGVNGIAFPTEGTIKFAQNEGYKTSFSSSCCAQAYSDVTLTDLKGRTF
jgi:uncharacterized radical SAM superfamily protein